MKHDPRGNNNNKSFLKDGNVVYAELDLNMKTEGSPAITGGSAVRMTKEDATEYAEILPTQPPASSPKAE